MDRDAAISPRSRGNQTTLLQQQQPEEYLKTTTAPISASAPVSPSSTLPTMMSSPTSSAKSTPRKSSKSKKKKHLANAIKSPSTFTELLEKNKLLVEEDNDSPTSSSPLVAKESLTPSLTSACIPSPDVLDGTTCLKLKKIAKKSSSSTKSSLSKKKKVATSDGPQRRMLKATKTSSSLKKKKHKKDRSSKISNTTQPTVSSETSSPSPTTPIIEAPLSPRDVSKKSKTIKALPRKTSSKSSTKRNKNRGASPSLTRRVQQAKESLAVPAASTHSPVPPTRVVPLKGLSDEKKKKKNDQVQDRRREARKKLAGISWKLEQQQAAVAATQQSPATPTKERRPSRLAVLKQKQRSSSSSKKSSPRRSQRKSSVKKETSSSKKRRAAAKSTLAGISERLRTQSQTMGGSLMMMRDALAAKERASSPSEHPTFAQIFDMFEAGLEKKDHVPFSSRSNQTKNPTSISSHKKPSSPVKEALRPQVDLACLLRHVVVLNEFQELTSPTMASSIAKSPLLRMFQLKCTLLSIMGDDNSEDILPKLQGLHDHYDVEPSDLKFILEHIALCQQQDNMPIRWDLVQAMFFPEHEAKGPLPGHGHTSMPILDFHHSISAGSSSNGGRLWSSTADVTRWNSSFAGEASLLGSPTKSPVATFAVEEDNDGDDNVSPREALQEVMLELYEMAQEAMPKLKEEERQVRRRILVELLQSTNEEECPPSSVGMEDLLEIAHHVRLCQDTGAPVEWDLIGGLVFPLGVEVLPEESKTGGTARRSVFTEVFAPFETSPGSSHDRKTFLMPGGSESYNFSTSFYSPGGGTATHSESYLLGESHRDELQNMYGLSNDEIDVILNHIRTALGAFGKIRWDLIGKVLFPDDRKRRKLMADINMSEI